ncbi:MAG: HU family DNA-binding protein, partial [Gammaproteobacteria bacterium]|nr:HU family DNA-binding protein [Gammaproteobacteria bacterium]
MRKPELAAAIAENADLSKDKAGQVLNVILDEITNSCAKGEDVALIGFGTFTVRARAARTGKNPQTGAPLQI